MATTAITPAPTETAQTSLSFDQAFEKAKADAAETPVQPEVQTEEAVEQPEEVATQEEAEQQPAEETGEEAAQSQESSEDELLSAEEYDALKSNPEALRKALNRSYTQKTQKLAPYRRLIESWEKDPDGTLEQLARSRGVQLQRPAQPQPQPQANQDDIVQMAKDALGPELAPLLAEPLAKIAQKAAEKMVGPVQQNLQAQAAQNEAASAMSELEASHPDWKQFEGEMTRLSQVFQPAIGADGQPLVTAKEYMDNLYQLASRSRTSAEVTRKVVAKINRAAEASENPDSGVTANRVSSKPEGRLPTFSEAWQAAKRQERWD